MGHDVAVIGLGAMGLGMARSLKAAGQTVIGVDPQEARTKAAEGSGILTTGALSEAMGARVVLASLPTAAHVEGVVEGDGGFLQTASDGAVLVDTSTSEADVSRRLAALCAEKGLGFLDAPVSGGPSGAETGALTVMLGGEDVHRQAAATVLEAIAAPGRVFHVGPPGAGNVAKLANNLLVAAHLLTAAEAVRLSEAAGVSAEAVLSVVNAASGRSAVTEVNFPRWVETDAYDSGFTMGLMRKDVRLAAKLASSLGEALPVSALVGDLWAKSAHSLADDEDFNRIVSLVRHPGRHDPATSS
ncbi:MAG: NAD(P)-dependent oxidoreductase [Pseudomonadota bacterium]